MNMNRHHPYGGGYDAQGGRRGGPPGGFGPDRSHRFSERGAPSRGRGGLGRGRGGGGGYGGYDGGVAPYDQGPPQGDLGGYNNYDAPPQDPYYQNGSYNAGVPGQYAPPADPSTNYDQGYGNSYEDGAGQNYGSGGGYGGKFKRGPRRERDDKVHDSIIEERIQRERPCRTLFIRNIKASPYFEAIGAFYETNSDEVRRLFEEHGEIRTFFDLIAHRGMVFVTYYDLRAAERARDRLQGSEISGRPIDVHYSLPRDDHSKGGDKEKNQLQGTLLVTLKNSATNQAINDEEVRRKFQQFGDVKAVKLAGDRDDQRYVEFFDTRAADEAHDRLRHQGLQDGVMDIIFAADNEDQRGASPRRRDDRGSERWRDWDDYPSPSRGRRGGRGGRGRGRGWGSDDWERRDSWNSNRNERGRFDDDFSSRGPSVPRGGYDDRFEGRGSGYGPPSGPGGPPPPTGPAGYGAPPPPPPPSYPQPPPAAPAPDERFEQAKKVQQLLAALKQPQGGRAPSAPPPPTGPAAGAPQMPPMPPSGQAPPNPYYSNASMPSYPPPPASMPQYPPPMPPQTNQPPAGALASSSPPIPNLPPNILAMLQHGNQGPNQQQTPPPGPPQLPYNMPPPPQGMMASPPPIPGISTMPPANGQGGYQQLMAYLSQKRPQ